MQTQSTKSQSAKRTSKADGVAFHPTLPEHAIFYAFPSSEEAAAARRSKDGCWIFRIEGRADVVAGSFAGLLARIDFAKSTPARFSVDHPECLRFLTADRVQLLAEHKTHGEA